MADDTTDDTPAGGDVEILDVDGYAAAMVELESILEEIEGDDVDVDLLASRVERATALIEFCRSRILAAQDAVDTAAGTDRADDGD